MVKLNLGLAKLARAATGTNAPAAVFHCCDPCRDGRCGLAGCNHRELDGATPPAEWQHDGCGCWVALKPKVS